MATSAEAEGSEYGYNSNGGFQYADTADQDRLYNLKRQKEQNTSGIRQTARTIEPMRMEFAAITAKHARCQSTPWWAWVLLVIGVVIIVGLAAVLVFVSHSSPNQDTPVSPNTGHAGQAQNLTGANCLALHHAGYTTSGVHTISPDGLNKMTVYCEQSLDKGGWTVFQRRLNGQVDFNRKWSAYRDGFGDVKAEHWLGNENIHVLTALENQKLKIEMTHPEGTLAYADYAAFWTESETNNYRLHVSGFIPRKPPDRF